MDKEIKDHYCDFCGKPAIIYDFDPYLEEIEPEAENEENYYCESCYQERLNDI